MSDEECPKVGAAMSRRSLIKSTLVAGAAATGAALGSNATSGEVPKGGSNSAPRLKFRAYVSRGEGQGRTTLQELTLRPIKGRQVVVRTEAASLCYFNVATVLGLRPDAVPDPATVPVIRRGMLELANKMAIIQGHGGVGIVRRPPCFSSAGLWSLPGL